MAPPKDYNPNDYFPDLFGASPDFGPVQLQEDKDEVLYQWTWSSTHAISSTTNTTPIKVNTADPHRWITGDKVLVRGSGDPNAEGLHTITVITSTQFSLNGTTADGGAGAGGKVFHPKLGTFGIILDALAFLGKRFLGTAYTTGLPYLNGRKRLRRPRVVLSDAAHTVKVTDGDRFELPDNSFSGGRLIVLDDVTVVPNEGETMEFVCPLLTNGGIRWTFKRIDATIVATIVGTQGGDAANGCNYAEFEYVAGAWRLGANSGSAYDVTAALDYGVLPGPGA